MRNLLLFCKLYVVQHVHILFVTTDTAVFVHELDYSLQLSRAPHSTTLIRNAFLHEVLSPPFCKTAPGLILDTINGRCVWISRNMRKASIGKRNLRTREANWKCIVL